MSRARLLAALGIGIVAGAWTFWLRASGHYTFSDFDQLWLGARAITAGADPYIVVPRDTRWPLYYPMPAILIALPFTLLPMALASAVWTALGFALLAFALSARGFWPLVLLATPPAISAANLAQWTPILTAAVLLPWLAWLGVGKPTTGAALLGGWATPQRMALNAIPALVLVVLSFALRPAWFGEWLTAVRSAQHFVPLILRPGGFVMLAALVRWRWPEARMLLLLACVPMTMAAYDAVPLFLIPRTRREIIAVAVLACVAGVLADRIPEGQTFVAWANQGSTILFLWCFFPALAIVLRRPRTVP